MCRSCVEESEKPLFVCNFIGQGYLSFVLFTLNDVEHTLLALMVSFEASLIKRKQIFIKQNAGTGRNIWESDN